MGVVGCEPFLNGVVAALAGLRREQIDNVRLRRGDAQALVEAVPDGFFSRGFILYPDPWPKRRHRKRRVVAADMIEALARAMRTGASCVSSPTSTTTPAGRSSGFSIRPISAGRQTGPTIGVDPGPSGAPTRYEVKARKEGRGSVYLTFARL